MCKRRIRDQIGELSLESDGWNPLDHKEDFREEPGMS